jgi:hypothetical protein
MVVCGVQQSVCFPHAVYRFKPKIKKKKKKRERGTIKKLKRIYRLMFTAFFGCSKTRK